MHSGKTAVGDVGVDVTARSAEDRGDLRSGARQRRSKQPRGVADVERSGDRRGRQDIDQPTTPLVPERGYEDVLLGAPGDREGDGPVCSDRADPRGPAGMPGRRALPTEVTPEDALGDPASTAGHQRTR